MSLSVWPELFIGIIYLFVYDCTNTTLLAKRGTASCQSIACVITLASEIKEVEGLPRYFQCIVARLSKVLLDFLGLPRGRLSLPHGAANPLPFPFLPLIRRPS